MTGLGVASWTEAAICNQTDPESFFPDKGGSIHAAVRVCSSCPVKAECLDYALTYDVSGVWGGTSHKQRNTMRRKLGIKPDRTGLTVRDYVSADDVERLTNSGMSPDAIARLFNVTNDTITNHLARMRDRQDGGAA